MRELVGMEGLGHTVAGRQSAPGISTEIDFLYGHNWRRLPCLEIYYRPAGTSEPALGPGFAAGFTHMTPSMAGQAESWAYDPVRLLGVWERSPPRPEAR